MVIRFGGGNGLAGGSLDNIAVVLDGHPILWSLVLAVGIALIIYLIYLPIAVARQRGHPQKEAIAVCTVLGLFLWPLWLVALVWAHTVPAKAVKTMPKPVKRPKGYAGSRVLSMPATPPPIPADSIPAA